MTKIRNTHTKIVHEARLDPIFKGIHYYFSCGQWCNLEYLGAYEKVEDDTLVTCQKCLERMKRKDWKKVNDEIAKVLKEK